MWLFQAVLNCGTWENNASVIQSGLDKGRIAWGGKALRFTPRGGSFDLKNSYCFGFVIRVPENMRNRPFTVKFIYESGNPVVWNVRTPAHIGWRGVNTKILADRRPYIRPEKLKAVEFEAGTADFRAFLDDIRFVPSGLDFQFEDAWVPPVTNGCFFPEYTLEQQRKETLEDPEYNDGTPTLLLVCEEGEEEYDVSRMHTDRVFIQSFSRPEELCCIPE